MPALDTHDSSVSQPTPRLPGTPNPAAGKGASEVKPEVTPAAPVVDPNVGKKKYVVNGKDVFLTPEQAESYVQKGLAFEPRVSELARLQQETKRFLDVLRDDPAKILFNPKFGTPEDVLGKIMSSTTVSDKTKELVGKWYYEKVIAIEKMDPKDRELAESKQKLAEYEENAKRSAEQQLQKENATRISQAIATLKAQISEAMQESGMPDSASVAKRVAQVMNAGILAGKTVTPKEAINKVRLEILGYIRSYLDPLDEDKLVENLGKENAEKIRKFYLKQVKEAEKAANDKGDKRQHIPKRDVRKTMNSDQFRDYLDDIKRTGKK